MRWQIVLKIRVYQKKQAREISRFANKKMKGKKEKCSRGASGSHPGGALLRATPHCNYPQVDTLARFGRVLGAHFFTMKKNKERFRKH